MARSRYFADESKVGFHDIRHIREKSGDVTIYKSKAIGPLKKCARCRNVALKRIYCYELKGREQILQIAKFACNTCFPTIWKSLNNSRR